MRNAKLTHIRSLCFSSSCVPKDHFSPSSAIPSDSLLRRNFVPVASILQQYINSDSPSHGLKIHSRFLKIGFQPDTSISTKLLVLHWKVGSVNYARQVLEEMAHPTMLSCNYLLSAYVKLGRGSEAFDLVGRMCNSGTRPDSFTHSLILKAWVALPRAFFLARDLVRQVHAQVTKNDCKDDVILFACLIDSYVKSGNIGGARHVFDRMLVKNVMYSTSLITGYLSTGRFDDAETVFNDIAEKDVVFNAMIEGYSKSNNTAKKSLEIYMEMRRLSFLPIVSTFMSLIGACSVLTLAEVGQQVHSHLIKTKCTHWLAANQGPGPLGIKLTFYPPVSQFSQNLISNFPTMRPSHTMSPT